MSMPSPIAGGVQPQQQRAARPKTESGQLAENIPRAMRAGVTERIEVRIGKAAAKKINDGLEGGGVAWRHEVTITRAMSVRLRAPDGGFFIETVSPETQWIENNLGLGNDDFASWRFQVTPQSRGWARLQIVVSARTIGNDGMAAETALPDQIVDVKIRTNYKQTLARWGGWTLAAIVGGAFAKFGEGSLGLISTIAEKLIK
jgi:neural Wiskott-Aldrich syndrome protein